jgi:hypothetical protein
MGSRTWIKVYCDKWLEGTLREETSDIRGVWIDLLTLAGAGRYGSDGEIRLINGIGLRDEQISRIFGIKPSLWRKAKTRFLETDRIKITENGAILITNWSKYQSEYERLKTYHHPQKGQQGVDPDKYIKGRYGQMVRRGLDDPGELAKTYMDSPDLEDEKLLQKVQ